ncbi:hypothetical protein NUW58_g2662 [Xylaria curta]|uniref:Uncharacterized protein n=1 Tax=Xylaria curta TaxID=42375 RepID=A0ACC1PEI0_9PEZI|nr:hypothetical protein NUW58_g2662 [Xylaria curta]
MLQRYGVTGLPLDCNAAHDCSDIPGLPPARPISECEWKPFDLVQKRSGPHNLSQCRNVLVRFCAHVPRNFQYKDGIQQIFLILREHLGDENLDLAGGVLYELIEVDCEHTDDPGAAFQRWRHDHMYRYADLELPHIPHMTTITSSIVPTERLARWRLEHADRYRFVLSDSSPLTKRDYVDPSCIRNKKAWLIDHTLFVSTRSEGTRPIRSPTAKEFHEMQWDSGYGAAGKMVEEREFPTISPDEPSYTSPPNTADTIMSPTSRSQRLRHSLSSMSIIEKFVDKLGKQKKRPEVEQRRRSWMPNSFIVDAGSLFKDKRAHCGAISVPWPEGYEIPNAIFARKFLIVDNGETLPSHLPICQMPTAESKATETIVEAATTGLLSQASSWLFRGPFTPQLGFDGGLDYQWNPQDSSITVRRFDLDARCPDTPIFSLDRSLRVARSPEYDSYIRTKQSTSKRKGGIFDLECAAEVEAWTSARVSSTKDKMLPQSISIFPTYTSHNPTRSENQATDIVRQFPVERHEKRYLKSQLFDNVEFTIQTEPHNVCASVTNRQTTIVERPDKCETASAASAPLPGKINSYLGNTSYTVPLYSLNRKSPLGQFNSCAPYPSSDTPPSTSHLAVLSTPQQPTIKTTIDKAPFEMPRPRIPPPFSKTHPYHALPSHPPASTSVASSYLPREGSTPSLASLEIRDNSIRLVKPDLRLSPLSNLKDKDDNDVPGNATSCPAEKGKVTTMYRSKRNAQRDQCNAEGYGSQFKTMDGHSRSHSQHKQSFDAPQEKDYSRDHSSGPLIPKPYPSGGNDSGRSESVERGRTMQRCYEFIDTEDQAYPVLSRASEDAGDVGRESNMTTMTDLMQRCLESPPPKLPTRQNHQQQTQPKTKHRPPPLNLKDPVYVGMVERANRYEVEHNAIESSKAERFSSSVYGGRVGDPLKLDLPHISHRNESHGVDALQQYSEWRKNSKPAHTSSQGPTHVTITTLENNKFVADKRADENRLPITDHPIAQDTLVVGRVRSRTTLGIREDRDKEQRQRQFSDGSAYTPSEYSTTPFSYGSTTIHHSPQRNRQFSCGSGSKASQDDANINDVEIGTDMSSPIFTPLTPFIMKASGAPVGAERGAKTLIGEHGWLEDTAASASGAAKPKPKAAKAVGLMGSLKRKAREIVDSTSFKPTRNMRTSVVNPMNISLDAREQSLLYCELEYNLNNSLDAYFKGQLNAGRLEARAVRESSAFAMISKLKST